MNAIIIPKRNPAARLRLVCFPYAGGAASAYRTWAAAMPSTVELWAVQLPGREERRPETPLVRLAPMVAESYSALAPVLEPPFAFFGHSMGALIAFELARRLPPVKLFLSGCRGPHLPVRHSLHTLSQPQLLADLRRLGGTHDAVLNDVDLMQALLPAIYADLEASETYVYEENGPRLRCPITALGGSQDPLASEHDLAAWSAETAGEFRLKMFSGGHFYFRNDPEALLRFVSGELEEMT